MKTWRLNEDGTEIEENMPEEGEIQLLPTHEMAKPHNWVHYTKSILNCNRTSLVPVDAPDGEEDPEAF